MSLAEAAEPGRGRGADGPADIPWRGWKDILWRIYACFWSDRITLIAAGASFYLLLALFPALAAFVSLYGFVADPITIADHIAFLGGVLPTGGFDIIRTQLASLAQQDGAALSFAFVFGLAVALWSANNGIKTLFEALNVVYKEDEKRSFVWLNVISLMFTLGSIAIGILFIVSVGVVPAVIAYVGMTGAEETLIAWGRWPLLFVASTLAIAVLYRFGPSREQAKWRWLSVGSVFATVLWMVTSILFSWYLANFADYNATYGSLGAVIGFMVWTWLSVVILLIGAELNSEMEHQTARDSTTGRPKPMGLRGATMADTLGARQDGASARAEAEAGSRERPSFADGEHHPGLTRPTRPVIDAGVLLGFALPLVAIAATALLETRGAKRRPTATRVAASPRRAKAATAGIAGFLLKQGRAALANVELRDRLATASRTAMEYAQEAAMQGLRGAKSGARKVRPKKRWPW